MANGLFSGMLGFNPATLQQQRLQQFLAPVQQAQNPYERIGAALGTIGGGALFGIEDPQLQRASKIRGLMDSSLEDVDLSDPTAYKKSLLKLAENLKAAGESDAALYAANEAAKIKPEKEESPFAKIDPSKFTPASLREFAKTKDIGVLDSVEKAQSLKPSTEFLQTGQGLGIPARGSIADYSPQETQAIELALENKKLRIAQAGRSSVNVDVRSQTRYAETVGESAAKRDVKQFEAAETAINNLQKINTTLAELQTSDAITGLGAEIFNNVERFKLLVTANKKAGKKVSDTEYLDALLGSEVFPMIGALDIGARGLDTPPEREFLRKVMTGTIDMNRDTLIRLTKIRKDIEERAIERYNNRVKKGEYKEFFELQNRPPVLFEIPKAPTAPTAPAAAPTGQWRIVK